MLKRNITDIVNAVGITQRFLPRSENFVEKYVPRSYAEVYRAQEAEPENWRRTPPTLLSPNIAEVVDMYGI